ncbi:MAG: ATP-binding protein [Rhodospirillaceae bacterium]
MVRTVLAICSLLMVTIVLTIIAAVAVTTSDARHILEERAQLTVQILAGGASAALFNDDEGSAHALLGTLSRDPDYYASLVLDENGMPFVQHTIVGATPAGLVTARAPLMKTAGVNGSHRIGTLELTLSTARADVDSAKRGWIIAIAGIVLLVVVSVALALIIQGVTRPIRAMTTVMTKLAAGQVEVEVPAVKFNDEVGSMAAALTTLKSHGVDRLRFIARQSQHLVEIEQAVTDRTRELSATLDELRRTQDELVRSEKMAALGGMVAGIAHEINTPVGNSMTVATSLSRRAAEFRQALSGTEMRRSTLREFSEKVCAGTDLLVANLTRAVELISSFKRVAVDQTSERRRAFDLASGLGEIITMLKPIYKNSGHRIEIDVAPGIRMDSYPGALSQVITNLVSNALVHAFEGRQHGVVLVAARMDGGENVILTVADDGSGIDPRVLPRIFDPFFTTKLGSGGSGLGLHIVYVTVARILHGKISVKSEPGTGTTFTLTLPCTVPVNEPKTT